MKTLLASLINLFVSSKGYDNRSEGNGMERPVVKYECINEEAAKLIAGKIDATTLVQGSSLITDFGFVGDYSWTNNLIGWVSDSESLTTSDWTKWYKLKAEEIENELAVV